MISDHDDEVIHAMEESIALHREYSQKYVNTEPLPHNQDKKPLPYKELSELTAKIEAADQRFKELRLQHWNF